MSIAEVQFYVIRALQRAFVWLIETGAVTVKLDAAKTFAEKPAKPRKPREQRQAIQTRQLPSAGRKIQSRPFRKETT